jgi:Septum formation
MGVTALSRLAVNQLAPNQLGETRQLRSNEAGAGGVTVLSWLRTGGVVLAIVTAMAGLSGCGWVSSWFSSDDTPKPEAVSVLKVNVGQCFAAQDTFNAEIADLQSVACTGPHRQEAFAVVDYQPPPGVQGDAFPGDAVLGAYADAVCAQSFETYVGISYLDSSLYFTYLIPSARGWQESDDRAVVCFATTTGQELTSSVQGTKW